MEEAATTFLQENHKKSLINEHIIIEELKQDLESERAARIRADKQRVDFAKQIEDLTEKLDELTYANKIQSEQCRKREAELAKVQQDLADCQQQNEVQLQQLRKKYHDAQAEFCDQLDQLQKSKHRLEKEKHVSKCEFQDLECQMETMLKSRASLEKVNKQLEQQLIENNKKVNQATKDVSDVNIQKNKILSENSELVRKVEDCNAQIQQALRMRQQLNQQLDEAKQAMEELRKQSIKTYNDNKNLQVVIQHLEDQLEDSEQAKVEHQQQMLKLSSDIVLLNKRLEEAEKSGIKEEEMDEMKRRLADKSTELEQQLETALSKCVGLEKVKLRLQNELQNVTTEFDKCQLTVNQLEKGRRQLEKQEEESRRKMLEMELEMELNRKESRERNNESHAVRVQWEEMRDSYETAKKENQTLMDEIQDLVEQVSEANRKLMEAEKTQRRIEMEKQALQGSVEEAEAAAQHEMQRVQRVVVEVNNARAEAERLIAEKDGEMENLKRNHQRTVDDLQTGLDTEVKSRMEAMRIRKQLEQEIVEMEAVLESVTKNKGDSEKSIKKMVTNMRELEKLVQEERQLVEDAEERRDAAERKAVAAQERLQEMRVQLECDERSGKNLKDDMEETMQLAKSLRETNNSLADDKKRLEVQVQALQTELDDKCNEAMVCEEQARKANQDSARMAEDLRKADDRAFSADRQQRLLEVRISELQTKLNEAEAAAMQGGLSMGQRLEQRVHELELELEQEQHDHGETTKAMRRQERRLKELASQMEEQKTGQDKLIETINALYNKLKNYKRHAEEMEETANLNLTKFRKVHQEMEDAVERASIAENTLGQVRARSIRTSSVAPQSDTSPPPVSSFTRMTARQTRACSEL